MELNWNTIDRFVFGEAWTNSLIKSHADTLCEHIGPRWATSESEFATANFIREQFIRDGLDNPVLEDFNLPTWSYTRSLAELVEENITIDLLPFNRCPACTLIAPIVDVEYGTEKILEDKKNNIRSAIAVMYVSYEPFSEPIPLSERLYKLAQLGVVAVVCIDPKDGKRMEYRNAGDWRIPEDAEAPVPCVTTTREHGSLLMRNSGKMLKIAVDASFYQAKTQNVDSELIGQNWPKSQLIIGGHHDTVFNSPGGNDNASGTIAVLETARVLAALRTELGISPGCTIRFVTFSAEEQRLAGATEYVKRHCNHKNDTRLVINLDELSTGFIKGIVLAFPHLQKLVQSQLDLMGDGLKCHVMSQLDSTSDHFPFLRQGIDAAHLWRWRFHGRNADSNYHHETADTMDKINVRELKEYVGQLSRLLLRLSYVNPKDWPTNPQTPKTVESRLSNERGSVVRVY
tara:strand:+ start:695 stop:2068 length:1374 start_codon:yes stop_codon:yes gene_type:complete